ncbi:MAG: hemolysin family protein [Prolixibacteraceae bacterium]
MELFILALLIFLNGFFALSEAALISSKKERLEQYKSKGKRGAKIALQLLKNSENFLSAIQVGITLIGIVTGVYGGVRIAADVAPLFSGIGFIKGYEQQIALMLTVVLITYISIVVGELVPKTIALNNPEKIAIRVSPAILYFSIIFYPFVKLLSFSTRLFNRLLGIRKSRGNMTEEELRYMLKFASLEGIIEKEQTRIHEKVFYFSDKKAKHIMTHRRNVEWIDIEQPEDRIHEQILGLKHSKIVVCRKNIDDFTGILNVKEYLADYCSASPHNINALLKDPLVIPENSDAIKVMDIFREKQNYMALVVDEYGSFEGIITLHDILENIIGNFPSENEIPEPEFFIRTDQSILVNGSAPVEILTELLEDFHLDFDEIQYASVAGFVFSHLDNIPSLGDKIMVSGYVFEVIDMDNNKIDKVLIHKAQ